jgi:formylglycine-generating enzyme required for sulfatase activity
MRPFIALLVLVACLLFVIQPSRAETRVAVPPIQPSPLTEATSRCNASAPHLASLSSRSARPLSATEECGVQAKDVFKECDKCPEMVVVPAGSFTMGSPESEPERRPDESPQHQVTFSKAFAVGRFAVTFDEWDTCVTEGGCGGYRPDDRGWGRGRQPAVMVSWNDAKAYVAWLSKTTGKPYRLLSEAEREYVTRAGTTTAFWWGSSITPDQANYDGRFSYPFSGVLGAKELYRQRTLPVDSFSPNPWGLYQVHGNVRDWVEDCYYYHRGYAAAPTDGSAWTSVDCKAHVFRGGSWDSFPRFIRAADRNGDRSDLRVNDIGFRLARTLSP